MNNSSGLSNLRTINNQHLVTQQCAKTQNRVASPATFASTICLFASKQYVSDLDEGDENTVCNIGVFFEAVQ